MQRLGHRIEVAANGIEALQAMSLIPYDVVIMHCQMPEMDGYDTTAEIRSREGAARHTPIIAMTAGAMKADEDRARAAGMDDYLSKPGARRAFRRAGPLASYPSVSCDLRSYGPASAHGD